MLRYSRVVLAFLTLCSSVIFAQSLCPTGVKSDKLICLIPQVYGVNGLQLAGVGSSSRFNDTFLSSSLEPVNSAIGIQAALRPLASPSSGVMYTFDPVARVLVPSTESLGPIFGERAETVGKGRVFLGLDYQYTRFDSLDGTSLKRLPVVFTQPDDRVDAPAGVAVCSSNLPNGPNNTGGCSFIRDVIRTLNRLDLKVSAFTTFISVGISNSIDVSAAIPIENVRIALSSQATIVDNSNGGFHSFALRTDCGSLTIDSMGNPVFTPCRTQTFSDARSASGIGDITFRVKGIPWKGAKAGLALGVDVRLPTGDALNYLGAGAAGVKPFVVWSYRWRVSPYLFLGYEVNGNSILAGDINTGSKDRLPSQFTYTTGFDWWISRHVTTVFELVGQQIFQARRTLQGSLQEPQACLDTSGTCATPPGFAATIVQDPTLSATTGTFNSSHLSLGFRLRPVSTLLVTGNVLLRINNQGLQAKAAPLAGISYTF